VSTGENNEQGEDNKRGKIYETEYGRGDIDTTKGFMGGERMEKTSSQDDPLWYKHEWVVVVIGVR
jgi:hypothetical protein